MNTMNKTWLAVLAMAVPLAGCPGDDSSTTGTTDNATGTTSPADTEDSGTASSTGTDPTEGMDTTAGMDTTDGTTGGPAECMGTNEGTAAEGDPCTANSDCASGVCTLFTDVPVNEDAVCAPTPEGCATRITGTVFDFATGMPVADAEVKVAAALQAATNPTGAMALVTATSDAEGRFDGTSDGAISAALGIVALTQSSGFFLTSTGLAAPADGLSGYNVANSVHDIWVVPTDDLAAWSAELANDAEIGAEFLPLGDQGGVVGLVRDATGAPIEGAVVASTNGSSGAVIRYLNEDGSFNPDMTSPTGLFVIIDPAVPEDFDVSVGGSVVGGGTAGSAAGVVFTLIVNVE